MALLEIINMGKIYGMFTANEFEALKNINFAVEEKEFICVMGPSGSGKSTFINCISTIDNPSSGKVLINGKRIRTMSTSQLGRFRFENLGFIFQDFNLLDTHTLYENIAMPLALAKKDKNLIDKRVHELAKMMDIESLLHKKPTQCSGGQKQRAAICRALINNPKLIVADEPTGNLDSKNSKELMEILRDLNAKDGVTIIMVTHDALVASYSSRLIMIKDGRISEELRKGDMTQQEFFRKIVEINSAESGQYFRQ